MKTHASNKNFGEMVSIHKPKFRSLDERTHGLNLVGDMSIKDMKFDLRPELPSHVPTPETIDDVDEPSREMLGTAIQHLQQSKIYRFQTYFGSDSDSDSLHKSIKPRKDGRQPIRYAPSNITPPESPVSSRSSKLSPSSSTKWGPEIWNSMMINLDSSGDSSTHGSITPMSLSFHESFDEEEDEIVRSRVDTSAVDQDTLLREAVARKQSHSSPRQGQLSSGKAARPPTPKNVSGSPSAGKVKKQTATSTPKSSKTAKTKGNTHKETKENRPPKKTEAKTKRIKASMIPTSLDDAYVVEGQSNLDTLVGNVLGNDRLAGIFKTKNIEVEVKTRNRAWIPHIYLPSGSDVPAGSKFQLTVDSSWEVTIHYPKGRKLGDLRTRLIKKGETIVLVMARGVWVGKGDPVPAPLPPAPPAVSPLQKKWMHENSLNLHASCLRQSIRICDGEDLFVPHLMIE